MRIHSSANVRMRGMSNDNPAASRLRPSVSFGSVNSKLFITLASRSISSSCSDNALPTSRAALRLR
jgi:hypothetical protein